MPCKSTINTSEKVENTERHFGSATEYYPCWIVTGDKKEAAMFTEHDIQQAINRAVINPEDMPEKQQGFWASIFS